MTSSSVGVHLPLRKFLSIHFQDLNLYTDLDDKSRKIAPHPINIVKMADNLTNGERVQRVLWTNGR